MKLNKKYFSAVLAAFAIQIIFGVNWVNAMQCEKEIEQDWNNGEYDTPDERRIRFMNRTLYGTLEHIKNNYYSELIKPITEFNNWQLDGKWKSCREAIQNMSEIEPKYRANDCVMKFMQNNNCKNIEVFKYNKGSNQQSSSNNSSSNQSSSTVTSSSPESYNIQVSQNNKQNYQAVLRAYEQANAGKGKKHNKEANATECMKNNPAQKSFKNNCNQAINFTYCFSGTVSGAKNESPQTLAELNCQGGQFGTLTVGPGENIPGSYTGLALDGLACKSPSQPVDMAFDRSANAATGRCSF